MFLGGGDVGPWGALSKRTDDSDSWVCRVIWVYKELFEVHYQVETHVNPKNYTFCSLENKLRRVLRHALLRI